MRKEIIKKADEILEEDYEEEGLKPDFWIVGMDETE